MPSEEYIRKNYIQEDGSRAVLNRIDPEYLDDLHDETETWFQDIREITKCQDVEQISDEMFNKSGIKKAKLAELLGEVVSLVEKQREMVRDLRTANDLLKTELLESKSAMIKIQSEQLKCNTEQLQSLQTAVKSTVQNTMQSEMKSYSSVLAEKPQHAIISPEALKKVVQAVVEEEDRSKNVMLFGLEEDKNETISEKVEEVFVSVGEKPSFVASRIGKKSNGKARPVKVTLTGNSSVSQILFKAKRLRTVEAHKSVFISPDMSPDERARHKQLVMDLKSKISNQPDKRHFIRQGHIVTVDKT
jgi:hypothetical protein